MRTPLLSPLAAALPLALAASLFPPACEPEADDDDSAGDDDSAADDDATADDDTPTDDDTSADDDTPADDDATADDDTSGSGDFYEIDGTTYSPAGITCTKGPSSSGGSIYLVSGSEVVFHSSATLRFLAAPAPGSFDITADIDPASASEASGDVALDASRWRMQGGTVVVADAGGTTQVTWTDLTAREVTTTVDILTSGQLTCP